MIFDSTDHTGLFKMIVGVTQYTWEEYVVVPIDLEILRVFFYDMPFAVVMDFSAWSSVY